jgi:eukaryotic-like serine/threonine-protein kinase
MPARRILSAAPSEPPAWQRLVMALSSDLSSHADGRKFVNAGSRGCGCTVGQRHVLHLASKLRHPNTATKRLMSSQGVIGYGITGTNAIGLSMSLKLDQGDVLHNGRYEVLQHVRYAQDKEVYLAHDNVFDCQVSLDVFSNKATMPNGLRVSAWEARVLHKLGDHPNIASVQDYWEEGGAAIMATRYLPGKRLEDLIASLRETDEILAVQRILQLSVELADGLTYIHQRGLLYRDLQPHNILFDERGTPRLVDFDTAVSVDDHEMADVPVPAVMNYMAPELIYGEDADERADLYSLGATLYEMCDGHPPFIGTREEVLAAVPSEPPPLQRDDLPAALRDLVASLLAPDRNKRPASAAEVKEELIRLRAARENLDRLLASDVGTVLRPALAAYLMADASALTETPSAVSLQDDHRYLMLAVRELAETDYRRAVIDAATAAEMAIRWAISNHLQQKGWSLRDIDQTIRYANGFDELFARYRSLTPSDKPPISQNEVRAGLARVRNNAAHEGRIPSARKAIRAVEIALELVNGAHPLNG